MPTEPDDHALATLSQIHTACWQQLAAAASDKTHAWRLMALGTVGGSADAPSAELRTVVLREVDIPARQLLFFTDARSPKVAQIEAQALAQAQGQAPSHNPPHDLAHNPAHTTASLLLWSGALGWQLRLRVALQVATSGLTVSSRWARLKLSPAAQDYLSPWPPGTPLDSPLPPALPQRSSREHFAVVSAEVRQIDWLSLSAQGHRRALFSADGQGQWLTP